MTGRMYEGRVNGQNYDKLKFYNPNRGSSKIRDLLTEIIKVKISDTKLSMHNKSID